MENMTRNLEQLGENLTIIMDALCGNEKLRKYLMNTTPDPLNGPDVTYQEVFGSSIRVVPKITAKEDSNSVVVLYYSRFDPNEGNSETFDVILMVEIFVPMTQWLVRDERNNLRPFLIMGEVVKALNGLEVDGIGRMELYNGQLNFLTEEMSSYRLAFGLKMYV